ncbi:hypothetical protein EDF61_11016 [Arthrobacter sp. JUb115]|nr:hypothetical protein EDF61_11016 [Arthrobacter sp. JUb115]
MDVRQQTIDQKIHSLTRYGSISQFLESEDVPAGILSIEAGGKPLDVLNSPKDSKSMIVFFHGAIDNKYQLPVLSGQGISSTINASRVFISDPALYISENLFLSWYAGSSYTPKLQNDLTAIIKKLAVTNGADRIIFFGGSGGGFASLYYASQFENGIAVCFNPQTNIAKYNSRAIHDFTHYAYGIPNTEYNPLALLPSNVVTDLCELYRAEVQNPVLYIQNLNDRTHITRHLQPFFGAIHPRNELFLLAEKWGEGHTPPPKEVMSAVLAQLADKSNDVGSVAAQGFQKVGIIKAREIASNGLPS